MSGDDFVFTSRYDALGPPNGCDGQCEGTGFVPIHADETDPEWKAVWDESEKENPTDDGWHFVRCPKCNQREAG